MNNRRFYVWQIVATVVPRYLQGIGFKAHPHSSPTHPQPLTPRGYQNLGMLKSLLKSGIEFAYYLPTSSCIFYFFIYKFIHLFICLCIYLWLHWVFVAAWGLSLVAVSGGYSLLRCVGLSLWWLLLLQRSGSRCVGFSSCGSWALECRLSSCGARA